VKNTELYQGILRSTAGVQLGKTDVLLLSLLLLYNRLGLALAFKTASRYIE